MTFKIKIMMKAITFLSFLIIFTSCAQENKPEAGKASMGSESQKKSNLQEPLIVQDTQAVSVVNHFVHEGKIAVGGANADIKGFTSEAIQTAIDALHNTGNGGTVVLLPGNYDISAPVKLYDNMSLVGSGQNTVLKKCKGFRSPFALDADYGELQITVADVSGFKTGMGVAVYDEDQRTGWDLTTAKITGIKGNLIYIDNYLVRDYHADKKGTISNSCSVISAVEAENVRIADLTVDGSRETNDMIDGCRAGGIYLHKVHKAIVENVTVRNFNCDGISWQITEYVTVRNCEVYGCANSGLHPGTGSPFTLVEGNNSYNNEGYGLFVCWRVRNGIVRNNNFHNNGINGISTGHKDTDMLYAGNHIYENGSDGIHLRGELAQNAPHRSIFKDNLIENNGMKEKGYGLSVNCSAKGVILEDNIIRNSGNGKQAAAVMLMANSLPVELKNNKISGHPEGEVVSEKK
jgi:Pectate lyase superfamily protein/Right handed beta helix region